MPTIKTLDGRAYAGQTALDVVHRMKDDGLLTFAKTAREYMAFVSRNEARLNGRRVRHDSAEHFLEDLAALGVINMEPLQ